MLAVLVNNKLTWGFGLKRSIGYRIANLVSVHESIIVLVCEECTHVYRTSPLVSGHSHVSVESRWLRVANTQSQITTTLPSFSLFLT